MEGTGRSPIRRLLDGVVEPAASVRRPEDRSTARLIASMIIGPAALAVAALAAWALTGPGAVIANVEVVVIGAALPFFAAAFMLCRRGRNRMAVWILVVASSCTVFALQVSALLGYNPLYKPHDAVVLVFLVVPVVLAGTVLSRRETVLIAVAEVAAILLVPIAMPVVTYELLVGGPVLLVTVVSILTVSFSAYRERIEHLRRAELVAEIAERRTAEMELGRHRDELEVLVRERTVGLERAMDELLEANEAKSRFLANMSHELRTPLNSIIGFTGVMRQRLAGPLTEEQSRQLGMVDRSSRHLLGLINQLLDLARIEAGAETFDPETFAVADLLDEVGDVIGPLADVKGLSITVDHGPLGDHGYITSDRGKVRQILLNLTGNAVKFTERGGVTLAATPYGDLVLFTVSDSGIGIPDDEIAHIFDEYRQVIGAEGGKPIGTGLGLTVSRRLAVLLGGDIEVESEVGVGSRFLVTVATKCG
ncbi:MAG: ATP-binding protein [Coriobacteriia bacterium]|nr:ATP-binding protein [Coriobacteriia bacterium]